MIHVCTRCQHDQERYMTHRKVVSCRALVNVLRLMSEKGTWKRTKKKYLHPSLFNSIRYTYVPITLLFKTIAGVIWLWFYRLYDAILFVTVTSCYSMNKTYVFYWSMPSPLGSYWGVSRVNCSLQHSGCTKWHVFFFFL